ncbi:hypothetical protein QQS21_009787 [Conoideocrella luteorostrata]|uniref:Extracellular serine-rich protein n=1 Tax=Conoideocrella luteorostrata TaxID=1105319 RepID=A0AAJ0FQ18_9HYPO|nr:hypothetical protein QQS21_009787 [Conoideocrella luteorostrata]
MRFAVTAFGLAAIATSPILAQDANTIMVEVGAKGLTYSPANFEAKVGAKVVFHYYPKNHTVTQSSFSNPCQPLQGGGFFSGFVPTTASPSETTFTIEVKDTKPIWFYCGQGNHCQSGMIGAINAPKSGNTFEAFKALAKKASNSTSPAGGPAGGVLSNGSGSQSGSRSAAQSTAYTTKAYTSTWTSNGQAYTTTATTTAVAASAQTTWAVSTRPYTSTWTSNGQVFTTTATTTVFTTGDAGAQSTTTSKSTGAAAAAATGGFNVWKAGALAVGVAAML